MPKYDVQNTVAIGRPVLVYLDGNPVYMVLECDTDAGYLIRNKTDGDGNLILCGDEIDTETLRGIVTVEPVQS